MSRAHDASWLAQVGPPYQEGDLFVLFEVPDERNLRSNFDLNRVDSRLGVSDHKFSVFGVNGKKRYLFI